MSSFRLFALAAIPVKITTLKRRIRESHRFFNNMLDQSFSVENFAKIVDLQNRKGNYLEKEFFPEVYKIDVKIGTSMSQLHSCG